MRLFLSIFFGMIVVLSSKPLFQELQAAQRRGGSGCSNGVCGLPTGRLVTNFRSTQVPMQTFQLVPVQPSQVSQPTQPAAPPIPAPRVPPPKPTTSTGPADSDDLLLAQATTTQAPTRARVDQETRNSVNQLSTATQQQQPVQTFQLVSMPAQQQTFQQPVQLVLASRSSGGCSGGSCGGGSGRKGLFGRRR